jgi:hypothetical protein
MMKQWFESIREIGAYNPKLNITPSNVRLSNNLSPFTNFFLNVFINSIKDKNIIIAHPDIILRPIPLLSF